jgi:hypothetical protein
MNKDQLNRPQFEEPRKPQVKKLLDFSKNLREKILKGVHPVKSCFAGIAEQLFNRVNRGCQTKKGLIIMILVPIVIVASISTFFLLQKQGEEVKEKPTPGEFLQSGVVGNLEIDVLKAEEGSYTAFEVIEGEPQRIQKKYYAVYTRVFNPSNTEKVTFSSIKLVDDLKNEYLPDIRILFDLRSSPQGFKEFGRDMVIYPRVIREGNIVFPEINC